MVVERLATWSARRHNCEVQILHCKVINLQWGSVVLV